MNSSAARSTSRTWLSVWAVTERVATATTVTAALGETYILTLKTVFERTAGEAPAADDASSDEDVIDAEVVDDEDEKK